MYPCFCSPEELKLSRKAQLAAGRPPRYAGTCAALPAGEAALRVADGARPSLRFRVPPARAIEFDDLIHGPQRFASDDIGDFVIRRADGSVAFFLGNALDDATMAVTVVLRGDDHLANKPRQILLLEALGLPAPRYGHLPLLLGPGGAPLSKREGAASLHDLRLQGYLPGALRNYLVRLGQRRLRAIALLQSGKTYRAVAAEVGSSLSSVVRWHQSYRKQGKESLRSRPIPGRPPLLSSREKKQLEEILLRGALALGYPTDLWSLKRVGQVVEKRFGIRYSIANLWKLMMGLDWSCQKPETRARERDEKAISHWKRHLWPHIKKGRKTWRPSRVPR